MADDSQPSLPMEVPEPVERGRRRRRFSRTLPRSRRGEQTLNLMQTPVLERCALCGHRQTVLGDAAVCAGCGAMIFRPSPDDE